MDYKVIFKTVKDITDGDESSRLVFYKIDPAELPWYRRPFNVWKGLFRAYNYVPGLAYWFDPSEYRRFILPLKTLGDVLTFKEEQISKSRRHKEALKDAWKEVEDENG